MSKKDREFVKGANLWISERRLVIEEDKLAVEYFERAIINLKKQKILRAAGIKQTEKRIEEYIKDCRKSGHKVG